MNSLTTVLYGGAGGLTVVVLNLIELNQVPKEEWPDLNWLYWLQFIAWPLLGALLVHLYVVSDLTFKPIIAFNIGLSAPMTIHAWVRGKGPPFIDYPGESA